MPPPLPALRRDSPRIVAPAPYNPAAMASHRIAAPPAPRPDRRHRRSERCRERLGAPGGRSALSGRTRGRGSPGPPARRMLPRWSWVRARVLPIGAQSSLTGGATPMGDLVLDLQRFDRIVSIDADEAVVQPGVPIGTLQAALAREGCFYPPAPTFDGACAGGVVATNAAGAATFKYGTTRDWVRRLTVVLATGDVLDLTRGETTAHPDGYFEGGHRRRDESACPCPPTACRMFRSARPATSPRPAWTWSTCSSAPKERSGWSPRRRSRWSRRRRGWRWVGFTLPSESAATGSDADAADRAARDAGRHGAARGVDVAAIEHLDARSLAIVREDGATRRHQVAAPDDAQAALLAQIELPGRRRVVGRRGLPRDRERACRRRARYAARAAVPAARRRGRPRSDRNRTARRPAAGASDRGAREAVPEGRQPPGRRGEAPAADRHREDGPPT